MADQEKNQNKADLYENLWNKVAQTPQGRIFIGLLTGIVFLIAGFYNIHKVNRLKQEGIKTEAVIVSIRNVYKRKGGHQIFPTVKFTDKNGTTHEVELDNKPSAQENQKVTVLYLPSSPKTVVMDSPAGVSPVSGYICMGFSGIGWLAVLYNIIALMIYKKRMA